MCVRVHACRIGDQPMRAQGTVFSVPHALAYNDLVLGIYCLQACDMNGAVKLTLHTCAPAAPSYA